MIDVIASELGKHEGELTERRDDDDLRALCYKLTEGFREGKIPADEDSYTPKRGIKDLVNITTGGSEMFPLRTPVTSKYEC